MTHRPHGGWAPYGANGAGALRCRLGSIILAAPYAMINCEHAETYLCSCNCWVEGGFTRWRGAIWKTTLRIIAGRLGLRHAIWSQEENRSSHKRGRICAGSQQLIRRFTHGLRSPAQFVPKLAPIIFEQRCGFKPPTVYAVSRLSACGKNGCPCGRLALQERRLEGGRGCSGALGSPSREQAGQARCQAGHRGPAASSR